MNPPAAEGVPRTSLPMQNPAHRAGCASTACRMRFLATIHPQKLVRVISVARGGVRPPSDSGVTVASNSLGCGDRTESVVNCSRVFSRPLGVRRRAHRLQVPKSRTAGILGAWTREYPALYTTRPDSSAGLCCLPYQEMNGRARYRPRARVTTLRV